MCDQLHRSCHPPVGKLAKEDVVIDSILVGWLFKKIFLFIFNVNRLGDQTSRLAPVKFKQVFHCICIHLVVKKIYLLIRN